MSFKSGIASVRSYALTAKTSDIRDHAEARGFARGFTLAFALREPMSFKPVFLAGMMTLTREFANAFESKTITAQDACENPAEK